MELINNLLGSDIDVTQGLSKSQGINPLDQAIGESEFKQLLSGAFDVEDIVGSKLEIDPKIISKKLIDNLDLDTNTIEISPEVMGIMLSNPNISMQNPLDTNEENYKFDNSSLEKLAEKIAVKLDMPNFKESIKEYAKELAESKNIDPNELLVNLEELANLNPETVKKELEQNPKSNFLWNLPVLKNKESDFSKIELLEEFSDVKGKVVQIKEDINLSTAKTTQTLLETGQAVNVNTKSNEQETKAKPVSTPETREVTNKSKLEEESNKITKVESQSKTETKTETDKKTETKDEKFGEEIAVNTAPISLNKLNTESKSQNLRTVNEQISTGIKDSQVLEKLNVGGSEKISIQLHPESLGKVEVKLDMMKDGSIKALVLAEKSETLNALKLEVGSLQESLNNMGFSSGSDAFQFQHQNHNQNRSMSENVKLNAMEESLDDLSSDPYPMEPKQASNHNGSLNLIA